MKVGPLFKEYIHTEKIPHRHDTGSHARQFRYMLFPAIVALFIILLGRLFWMQIIQGSYYRGLSDSNRIKTTLIHAPRGIIFDRNGKPLVYNTPGYRTLQNGKTTFLTSEEAIPLLSSHQTNLEIDSLRQYPCKDACAHVVGYVGQISPEELKNTAYAGYQPTDVVGKMGIESYYEGVLKGIDGRKLTEVDSMGKPVRTLGQTDPIPGQNITLSLDEGIQESVARAMGGVKRGAAVVSKPDGQILAMYSAPSFDPNLFTMGKSYAASNTSYTSVEQVLTDSTNVPLLNRAISGTYPPGSTFKPLVAAAALQNNIIDTNFTVEDTGILKLGDFSFANWYYTQYGGTDGEVNVVKAIKRSNDIFFYKVGEMVGVDKLSSYAKLYGLGSPSGIDIPGEAAGLLPTRAWKQKVIGEPWYTGDDYHYGIGQGYLLVTPLQVNLWTQVIANAGTLFQPRLLLNTQGQNHPIQTGLLSQENANTIREGMIEACSTGGVAWPLFNFHVTVACKTGTAQHGTDTTLPHAWLTLFAPAQSPQIIVTVLSEDSGEGSNVAGPIAKQILEDYFGK